MNDQKGTKSDPWYNRKLFAINSTQQLFWISLQGADPYEEVKNISTSNFSVSYEWKKYLEAHGQQQMKGIDITLSLSLMSKRWGVASNWNLVSVPLWDTGSGSELYSAVSEKKSTAQNFLLHKYLLPIFSYSSCLFWNFNTTLIGWYSN